MSQAEEPATSTESTPATKPASTTKSAIATEPATTSEVESPADAPAEAASTEALVDVAQVEVAAAVDQVEEKAVSQDYQPQEFEHAWQARWRETNLYKTEDDTSKKSFYCLDFFPYPSGDGLSVGHCHNYIPTDVISRHMRMRGFNVLHPMGWDAFGLPAENRARDTGIAPRLTVDQNTANYKRQLDLIGCSYDWDREIDSSAPEYYKFTQWLFLMIHRRGLAYKAKGQQWWCPSCQTILANEQVHDGRCWRCDFLVEKKSLEQWYFSITKYADRLLNDLDKLDWPESTKEMQRNWIGRSEGTEAVFITEVGDELRVFTTRADTLFGAMFMVLAPEHELVAKLTKPDQQEAVDRYVAAAARTAETERQSTEREKTGVFTGSYAINPVNDEHIPIWIADYVLATYGTGAIMAVPAHDQRDFEFAQKFGLDVRVVVQPPYEVDWDVSDAYEGEGTLVNSGSFDGETSTVGGEKITEWLKERELGGVKVQYRMRDWLISRQRYWGAPIPMVKCPKCGWVEMPTPKLPVLLPEIADFQPTGDGRSPLAKVGSFMATTCPDCGGPAERETDTMDGFACSSWYFLRFADPHNDELPFGLDKARYWLPVDLYVGGAEHATMHLIYARFWTKVIKDAMLIDFNEPFAKLRHQGVVLAPDGSRMSKSRGNVIGPDEMVEAHGVDALRVYELFMGPFDQNISWNSEGIPGSRRWLVRVWNMLLGRVEQGSDPLPVDQAEPALTRWINRVIKRADEDIDALKFNTMIAYFMEFTNWLYKVYTPELAATETWKQAMEQFLFVLAPVAPHLAEEVWERWGHEYSVHQQDWPEFDESLIHEETFTLVIQVNGKVRDTIEASVALDEEGARTLALESERVQQFLNGQEVKLVKYVPGRLINVVVG